MSRRHLILLLAALLVAVAAGVVWWLVAPVVTLVTPTRGPAVHAIYATGNVEPVSWAKVTPLVRGRIVDLCRCEGRVVSKGDELARLDDREARAALAELEARAAFAAQEVKRYNELSRREVASAQASDRARSESEQAQAAVVAARERLGHLSLEAPLDGVVLRRDGEIGEVVEPGQVVFWVGQLAPLWVVAEVDEEDIPVVERGQQTLIKADAFPGQVLEGRVASITPKGDPVSKSYRVRIDLPSDTPLLIGMTVEINVVAVRHDDALLVPTAALSDDAVWTVRNGRAIRIPVTFGIRGTERTEVVSGLAEDEHVMLDPPAGLAEGDRVRPRRP